MKHIVAAALHGTARQNYTIAYESKLGVIGVVLDGHGTCRNGMTHVVNATRQALVVRLAGILQHSDPAAKAVESITEVDAQLRDDPAVDYRDGGVIFTMVIHKRGYGVVTVWLGGPPPIVVGKNQFTRTIEPELIANSEVQQRIRAAGGFIQDGEIMCENKALDRTKFLKHPRALGDGFTGGIIYRVPLTSMIPVRQLPRSFTIGIASIGVNGITEEQLAAVLSGKIGKHNRAETVIDQVIQERHLTWDGRRISGEDMSVVVIQGSK